MSFNTNDINRDNYEEFFILYMDGELNLEQQERLEVFLQANPDLQGELDMLLSTKLEPETFSMPKEMLFAQNMQRTDVSEELLMFVDGELDTNAAGIVTLEIDANPAYRQQYELLLAAKLDAAEKIEHPNKEELYRRTERRVVGIPTWMRMAAAAVVLFAVSGVVYFGSRQQTTGINNDGTVALVANPAPKTETKIQPAITPANTTNQTIEENPDVPVTNSATPDRGSLTTTAANKNKIKAQAATASANNTTPEDNIAMVPRSTNINTGNTSVVPDVPVLPAVAPQKENIYAQAVTSGAADRITDINTTASTSGSASKSVRGLLRKATRLIEKRTGIDPTNDDGELLIGVVAIKVK